jgi:hypothetical protein
LELEGRYAISDRRGWFLNHSFAYILLLGEESISPLIASLSMGKVYLTDKEVVL